MATQLFYDAVKSSAQSSGDEILFGFCAVSPSGQRVTPVMDTEQEVVEFLRGFEGYSIQKVKHYFSFYGASIWSVKAV